MWRCIDTEMWAKKKSPKNTLYNAGSNSFRELGSRKCSKIFWGFLKIRAT